MNDSSSEILFVYSGEDSVPKNVTRVVIDASVTKVARGAFYYCAMLTEVVLNEGLEIIGNYAFNHCTKLKKITLPSTITEVGREAFSGCDQLKHVILNEGLCGIGTAAFKGCLMLETITIPSTVTKVDYEDLKIIGTEAFSGCTNLRSITLPSTFTEIAEGAFQKCEQLEDVVLNEGLKYIGKEAFCDCSNLRSITLPSTVTEVAKKAFEECEQLEDVVLNEGLDVIGGSAFHGCINLKSITLPSTVTKVGKGAFLDCMGLREVVINERLQNIKFGGRTGIFAGCSSLRYFKYPSILKRLKGISPDRQREINTRINQIPHVQVREGGAFMSAFLLRGNQLESACHQIQGLLRYFELKEATIMFELAFWKAMITEHSAISIEERDACRIAVPGPVKETIMEFLHSE